jgi:hypothetical protein
MLFAAAHESGDGTFRTWLIWLTMSVIEGEADLLVTRADVWE